MSSRSKWLAGLGLAVVAAGVVGLAVASGAAEPILRTARKYIGQAPATPATAAPGPAPEARSPRPRGPWDGLVHLDEAQVEALGLRIEPAAPQDAPMTLELLGTTEYDPDTLTKIRPRFDTLVSKVLATVGQTVKKGQPLIELYSVALAEAKLAYEEKSVEWEHDQRMLERHQALYKQNSIPERQYFDTVSQERKSRLEAKLARDKLLVYGLTEEQIGQVTTEDGSQKARMTLYAPGDGIVITRDVVEGNLYDMNDTLMVIAPLDHLWVWGNVYESDLDKVQVGQVWEIQFPYIDERVKGRVEYISNRVDPVTHAVRIRATIDNPQGRFKSDMLVRALLEIPPRPGRTVVPRGAMVTGDGESFLFVRRRGPEPQFERRAVKIAQEKSDHVVVAEGLAPGEDVVTRGGLLLAQIYEDLCMVEAPPEPPRAPVGPRPDPLDDRAEARRPRDSDSHPN